MQTEIKPYKTSPIKRFLRNSNSLLIHKNTISEESQNNNNNHKDNNKKIEYNNFNEKKKRHLLIVQKINIKDLKNRYYKEGVKGIFNDENLFFSDKYKNNRVVVGKNKSIDPNFKNSINIYSKTNLNNYNKKRFHKASTTKNLILFRNRKDDLRKKK